jgi:hypothetical protein
MKGDGIPLNPTSGPLLPRKDLFAGLLPSYGVGFMTFVSTLSLRTVTGAPARRCLEGTVPGAPSRRWSTFLMYDYRRILNTPYREHEYPLPTAADRQNNGRADRLRWTVDAMTERARHRRCD